MPQNLPEQILQRIVRLSADGNSQREVARMLGVSQGCISKILRCNQGTDRPHQRKRGGSMKISTPREDRQLLRMVRTNRYISAPHLRMPILGGGCQFEPFGDGFWSPNNGLGVQSDVLSSLWSTGDTAVSRAGGTECETPDNGDTVSSVMSPGSSDTTVTVGSGCAVGKRRGWLMPASSLMMEIVARQPWYGVQSTMGGGMSWSWWVEPWNSIGTSRSWRIKCCHERRGCLKVTLCTSKTMPRPIQHVTRQPLDPRHGWPPFHRTCSWTEQCCPPGMGCSSARKGADPGREHPSSFQGSSGR